MPLFITPEAAGVGVLGFLIGITCFLGWRTFARPVESLLAGASDRVVRGSRTRRVLGIAVLVTLIGCVYCGIFVFDHKAQPADYMIVWTGVLLLVVMLLILAWLDIAAVRAEYRRQRSWLRVREQDQLDRQLSEFYAEQEPPLHRRFRGPNTISDVERH